jgi:site-specific DNA recombinase
MGNDKVKVALYSRVSSQEQADEGTSLEHQEEQISGFCQIQNWEILHKYIDAGYTGKDDNRPGLKQLLSDAKRGIFTKVVVYKLDRLARKLRLLLEIEEQLMNINMSLLSVKETIDTSTPIGRTVFQVLGLVSEWEREAIIERTKSGRIQRYREGSWAGGKPPYGYTRNRLTKKLDINNTEALVVRRIFDQYRSGKSLSATADFLNSERIIPRSTKGKGWRATAIRNILINPAYKGTLIVNRHEHISNIARVDMDKAIIINVPAVIPENHWQLVQQRLTDNKHVRHVRQYKWLLQGLVSCGMCGFSFKAEGNGKNRYYNCRGKLKYHHLDGSPRCTMPRLRADWLEGQVWQRIEDIINDPNTLRPLIDDAIESLRRREEELQASIQPIDDRLTQIAEQKSRLADDWVKLNMDSTRYREMQLSLNKEETRLRSIRNAADPAQLAQLEETRYLLRFWQEQSRYFDFNFSDDNGSMIRIGDKPHDTVMDLVGINSKEVSNLMQFPSTKRELIDKLQVRAVVFGDRIEVKALFPIRPISNHKCTSAYQGEGDKGDRVT